MIRFLTFVAVLHCLFAASNFFHWIAGTPPVPPIFPERLEDMFSQIVAATLSYAVAVALKEAPDGNR